MFQSVADYLWIARLWMLFKQSIVQIHTRTQWWFHGHRKFVFLLNYNWLVIFFSLHLEILQKLWWCKTWRTNGRTNRNCSVCLQLYRIFAHLQQWTEVQRWQETKYFRQWKRWDYSRSNWPANVVTNWAENLRHLPDLYGRIDGRLWAVEESWKYSDCLWRLFRKNSIWL